MDWLAELRLARGPVDGWIERTDSGAWLAPRRGPWTRKDLLGHLAAWSDFLLDQVEALRDDRPDSVEAIEVDAWNAAEVERRRHWTIEATVAAWRQSAQRADELISGLPPQVWEGRWRVTWAAGPVTVADVLRLMVVHLAQHRSSLDDDNEPLSRAGAARPRQPGAAGGSAA